MGKKRRKKKSSKKNNRSSSKQAKKERTKTNTLQKEGINIGNNIKIKYYRDETEIGPIKKLMDLDLSEPYSIFTYRYFINNWPKLCLVAYEDKKIVGAVICKIEEKKMYRGYIAMLVVDRTYRKKKIGSSLVKMVISEMQKKKVTEVVLETEIINTGALRLYENLGFMRVKRLCKYYLNGGDAFRLKLFLKMNNMIK